MATSRGGEMAVERNDVGSTPVSRDRRARPVSVMQPGSRDAVFYCQL